MGQCISVEINPNNKAKDQSQQSILNHKSKSGPGSRKAAKKGAKRADREESSDEETSDEELDAADAAKDVPLDPNFGKQQSPINIVTCGSGPLVIKPMTAEDFEQNPLRFNYPDIVRECTIVNTGHTVQVNIPEHSKCSMFINGKTYNLKQFHFHTPSEHTIDDEQYEMEMHLVHINEQGEIAVLGFIFTTKQTYFHPTLTLSKSRKYLIKKAQSLIMGSDPVHQDDEKAEDSDLESDDEEENGKTTAGGAAANTMSTPGVLDDADRRRSSVRHVHNNDFLAQFWSELPLKKTESEIPLSKPISFDYLFETASKNFKKSVETNEIQLDMEIFQYDGSLTTPPYSEGVQWLLARKTHFINGRQLNKLSSCWGHHNNARECQHYHGREVKLRNQSAMKGYFFQ